MGRSGAALCDGSASIASASSWARSSIIAFVALIATRERAGSGIRQTRAILLDVRAAMEAYLADHEGECPKTLAALTDYGAFKDAPRDAWGRPLRLLCPGRGDRTRYEIWSDGPDGQPGGLDRIE